MQGSGGLESPDCTGDDKGSVVSGTDSEENGEENVGGSVYSAFWTNGGGPGGSRSGSRIRGERRPPRTGCTGGEPINTCWWYAPPSSEMFQKKC